MLLRNKLSIISLLFFLAAAGGLSVTLKHLSDIRETELGSHISTHQVGLWQKIVEEKLGRLENSALLFTGKSESIKTFGTKTDDEIREIGRHLFLKLKASGNASRVELYTVEGDMAYSSQVTHFPTPILNKTEISKISLDKQAKLGGLAIDLSDGAMVTLAVPIANKKSVEGVVVLATPVDSILRELSALTGGDVFLVNRRGRLLSGTNTSLWKELTATKDSSSGAVHIQEISVGEFDINNKTYWVTASNVKGIRNPIGHIATIKDISESQAVFEKLERSTYLATITFLILATLTLWGYMRQSFNPLNEAIGTLKELSQGNFPPRIRVGHSGDEVTSIGLAINKFRGELMRLASMTRSRHNRSRRQARLIRRELTNVAMNLDEQARRDTLADLRDIEERIESASDANQDVQSGRELAAIALTLTRLRERIQLQHGDLVKTIAELEEALVEKNAYIAVQHELSIGTKVQHAMLPNDLPATKRLQISGQMKTAKEVGGDFYDFFYLDNDRLGIVIADVSGKGVPAALFMAISCSVLRATAQVYSSPGTCLAAVNNTLCRNNEESYFVTILYGILNLRDGNFTYANGGHNPPLLLSASDKKTTFLPLTGGMALGAFDEVTYKENQVQLLNDDVLLLYTDGITEAIDDQENEYQEYRLENKVKKSPTNNMSEFLDYVIDDVYDFAGETPQEDDITCVAVKFLKDDADML